MEPHTMTLNKDIGTSLKWKNQAFLTAWNGST